MKAPFLSRTSSPGWVSAPRDLVVLWGAHTLAIQRRPFTSDTRVFELVLRGLLEQRAGVLRLV
jgi:hypothetical protein